MGVTRDRRRARQLRTFAAVYKAHDRPAMRWTRYILGFLLAVMLFSLALLPSGVSDGSESRASARDSGSGASSEALERDGTCATLDIAGAPVPSFIVLVLLAGGKIVVNRDGRLPMSAMRGGESLAQAANRTAFPALRETLDFDAHCAWLDALPETTCDGVATLRLGVRCALDAVPLRIGDGWELGAPTASAARSAARFIALARQQLQY